MALPIDVAAAIAAQPDAALGQVTDVRHLAEGVRVEIQFPLPGAPVLPVGRGCEVEFSRAADAGAAPVEGEDSSEASAEGSERELLSVVGKVALRGDGNDVRVYEFQFSDRTRQALSYLLEPRRSFRVYPDEAEPVMVTVDVPSTDGVLILPARDLSTTGVAVEVPWEHEVWLCNLDSVDVRLMLPSALKEIVFEGRIRNRCLGERSIVYGYQFVDLKAGDPRLSRIEAFVNSRIAGRTLGLATSGPSATADGTPARKSA